MKSLMILSDSGEGVYEFMHPEESTTSKWVGLAITARGCRESIVVPRPREVVMVTGCPEKERELEAKEYFLPKRHE